MKSWSGFFSEVKLPDPSVMGGVALFLALFIGLALMRPDKGPETSSFSTAETRIVELAAICIHGNDCVGGFVETKDGKIYQIDYRRSGGSALDVRTFPISTFEAWQPIPGLAAQRLKRIVLPNPTDHEWKEMAIRHATAFVVKK